MIRTVLVSSSTRSVRSLVARTRQRRGDGALLLPTRRWQRSPPSSKSAEKTATTTTTIAGETAKDVVAENSISVAVKSFGIGGFAGLLGSLAGMGGGFVMIPLMTSSLLRLSQHQAHGTSLFAVAATGLAGAWSYGPAVEWEPAVAVALTGMVTARFGARTTTSLSERALKRALGVLMLAMSIAVPAKAHFMEQYKKEEEAAALSSDKEHATDNASPADNDDASNDLVALMGRVAPAAAIGTCSGFMAGLFGVGGGVIVVPALTLFTSCNHYQALATSLAAMTLPAITGTWTHHGAGNVALRVAPGLAVGALVGAAVGGQVGTRTDESTLRWGFASLLAILGTRTLLKA